MAHRKRSKGSRRASRDLTRKDALGAVLQQAFPLPESGAFADLVQALRLVPGD